MEVTQAEKDPTSEVEVEEHENILPIYVTSVTSWVIDLLSVLKRRIYGRKVPMYLK